MSNVCSLPFAIFMFPDFTLFCKKRVMFSDNHFTSDNIYYVKSRDEKTVFLHLIHLN